MHKLMRKYVKLLEEFGHSEPLCLFLEDHLGKRRVSLFKHYLVNEGILTHPTSSILHKYSKEDENRVRMANTLRIMVLDHFIKKYGL